MIGDGTPARVVARVRGLCLALPEAYEEHAWVGIRWRVRGRTFAHVLTVANGWPPAYSRAAGTDGPAHVLMFRAVGPELDALRAAGPPCFATPWRADELGMLLTADTDWSEVSELLVESYRVQAPKRLVRELDER